MITSLQQWKVLYKIQRQWEDVLNTQNKKIFHWKSQADQTSLYTMFNVEKILRPEDARIASDLCVLETWGLCGNNFWSKMNLYINLSYNTRASAWETSSEVWRLKTYLFSAWANSEVRRGGGYYFSHLVPRSSIAMFFFPLRYGVWGIDWLQLNLRWYIQPKLVPSRATGVTEC